MGKRFGEKGGAKDLGKDLAPLFAYLFTSFGPFVEDAKEELQSAARCGAKALTTTVTDRSNILSEVAGGHSRNQQALVRQLQRKGVGKGCKHRAGLQGHFGEGSSSKYTRVRSGNHQQGPLMFGSPAACLALRGSLLVFKLFTTSIVGWAVNSLIV